MATVLITGATDGIGKALAQQYSANSRLVLVGRRPLTDLDGPLYTETTYCRADLAERDAPHTIRDFLTTHNIERLDVLVHNAGIGSYGPLTDETSERIQDLVNVNYRTPVALTHTLLPWLDGAKVVFISSVAANLPTADYTVYAATKSALDGFANNLRVELNGYAHVQLIHPGATKTGMHGKIGADAVLDTSKYPTAEAVATQIKAIIDGDGRGGAIGFSNKALLWAGKHAARLIDTMMKGQANT